jgi:hypothetical protein
MTSKSLTIATFLLLWVCSASAAIPGLALCPLKGLEDYALEVRGTHETGPRASPHHDSIVHAFAFVESLPVHAMPSSKWRSTSDRRLDLHLAVPSAARPK